MKIFLIFLLLLAQAALAAWEVVPSGTTAGLSEITTAGKNLYVGGAGGILLRSPDSGKTWKPLVTGQGLGLTGLAFRDSATGILLTLKGILRTTNGGETWIPVPSPDTAARFDDVVFRPSYALLVGSVAGLRIWRSTDGGASWGAPDTAWPSGGSAPIPMGVDGANRFCFAGSDTGYLAANRAILKTGDGGGTWSIMKQMSKDPDFPATFFMDCGFSTAKRAVFSGSYYGHMVMTEDGGASLTTYPGGNPGFTALHFPTSSVGYAAGSQGTNRVRVSRTVDGGISWSAQELPPSVSGYLSDVFFLNANLGIVVGTNGVILRTEDGGGSPVSLSPAPRPAARPRILGLFGKMVDALGRSLRAAK